MNWRESISSSRNGVCRRIKRNPTEWALERFGFFLDHRMYCMTIKHIYRTVPFNRNILELPPGRLSWNQTRSLAALSTSQSASAATSTLVSHLLSYKVLTLTRCGTRQSQRIVLSSRLPTFFRIFLRNKNCIYHWWNKILTNYYNFYETPPLPPFPSPPPPPPPRRLLVPPCRFLSTAFQRRVLKFYSPVDLSNCERLLFLVPTDCIVFILLDICLKF